MITVILYAYTTLNLGSIQCSCTSFVISRIRVSAATPASRFGLNVAASGFSFAFAGSLVALSHESSNGYRCWIGRYRWDFLARKIAAPTSPSLLAMRSSTIPSFHFPVFLLPLNDYDISQLAACQVCSLCCLHAFFEMPECTLSSNCSTLRLYTSLNTWHVLRSQPFPLLGGSPAL